MKRTLGRCTRAIAGETLMVRSLHGVLMPRLKRLGARLGSSARVLDIGSKNALYRSFFSHCLFYTVDVEPLHKPDIVADIHKLDKAVEQNSYDVILCTEVLEHSHTPAVAIEQIRLALKPGGIMLASTPFIVPYHPDPTDFWRMTAESWTLLTKTFSQVEIASHGNQLLTVWYLAGMGWGMPLRMLDWLMFTMFRRLRGNEVFLGFVIEARR
jgi:SAM-dependent methyltransferase